MSVFHVMVRLALFDVPQKFEVRMESRQYTFKRGETRYKDEYDAPLTHFRAS